MSAVTASLCSTLMFVLFVSADPKLITVESGQDVTLPCRAPDNKTIVVEWSRADLGDEYVLLYRDGHFAPANQHPSFKNRVDLQDRQMKDGDVSLILKDVTTADDGIYQCHVNMEGTHSWKLSSIYLIVDPPGTLGRYPVWTVALIVCMVLPGILLVGFLIYTKIQEQRKKIYKQSVRSYKYSQVNSDPPAAAPKSHSYPARRKTEDQSQKNTDYANLQTPQLNCEAVIEI